MWLFSSAPEDPEVNTVMEMHGAEALYSAGRVWCMLSGLRMDTRNRIWHTGWFKLQSLAQSGGGQNRIWQMGNHLFGYWRRMHTFLFWNGLKTSKENWRPARKTENKQGKLKTTKENWRRTRKAEDCCGERHFTGCLRSMEGTQVAAGILLIGIGRHLRLEWRFWTMVQRMATRH